MARPRRLIRTQEAAELIGCSSRTIKRGAFGFRLIPMNPNAKRVIWMVQEKEVEAFLEERLRHGKG